MPEDDTLVEVVRQAARAAEPVGADHELDAGIPAAGGHLEFCDAGDPRADGRAGAVLQERPAALASAADPHRAGVLPDPLQRVLAGILERPGQLPAERSLTALQLLGDLAETV